MGQSLDERVDGRALTDRAHWSRFQIALRQHGLDSVGLGDPLEWERALPEAAG